MRKGNGMVGGCTSNGRRGEGRMREAKGEKGSMPGSFSTNISPCIEQKKLSVMLLHNGGDVAS